MQPERYCRVNNHLVKEIYWAREYLVYVDHRLTKFDYETCIDMINNDKYDELFYVIRDENNYGTYNKFTN